MFDEWNGWLNWLFIAPSIKKCFISLINGWLVIGFQPNKPNQSTPFIHPLNYSFFNSQSISHSSSLSLINQPKQPMEFNLNGWMELLLLRRLPLAAITHSIQLLNLSSFFSWLLAFSCAAINKERKEELFAEREEERLLLPALSLCVCFFWRSHWAVPAP